MPQLTEPDNLPHPPYAKEELVLAGSTLRQTVRVSAGGRRMRLRFSNAFGGAPLPITQVCVAFPEGGRAGVSAVEAGTARRVTFSGRSSVVVPVGAQFVSDPLDLPLAPATVLAVTVHLADGQASRAVTSHPGSRTTSYLAPGNQAEATDLTGSSTGCVPATPPRASPSPTREQAATGCSTTASVPTPWPGWTATCSR